MPHKGQGIKSQYSQVALNNAVDAVKSTAMSVRQASQHFGVPRSTIQDRLSGRVEVGISPGKQPVFSKDVEDRLAEKIKGAASMGMGLSRQQIIAKAAQLARTMKIKTPFKNGIPGKDWVDGFLRRHPDLSLRSPSPLSTVRCRMLNKVVTQKYFDHLSQIIADNQLHDKPHAIWYMDETSVSLCHRQAGFMHRKGLRTYLAGYQIAGNLLHSWLALMPPAMRCHPL